MRGLFEKQMKTYGKEMRRYLEQGEILEPKNLWDDGPLGY